MISTSKASRSSLAVFTVLCAVILGELVVVYRLNVPKSHTDISSEVVVKNPTPVKQPSAVAAVDRVSDIEFVAESLFRESDERSKRRATAANETLSKKIFHMRQTQMRLASVFSLLTLNDAQLERITSAAIGHQDHLDSLRELVSSGNFDPEAAWLASEKIGNSYRQEIARILPRDDATLMLSFFVDPAPFATVQSIAKLNLGSDHSLTVSEQRSLVLSLVRTPVDDPLEAILDGRLGTGLLSSEQLRSVKQLSASKSLMNEMSALAKSIREGAP